MIQVDTMGIILTIVGVVIALVGALIVFLTFVSSRPTREEMNEAIKEAMKPIAADIAYIKVRIDNIPQRRKI